jgi:steroid 5-alpha reductase family enzyme
MDIVTSTLLHVAVSGVAAWVAATLGMTLLWLRQEQTRDASTVDVGWVCSVAATAVLFAATAGGWPQRRLLVALMFGIWGTRLAAFLVRERLNGRGEDSRYRALRAQWGASQSRRFFWFFQAQALAAVFFALPGLLASANPNPSFTAIEGAALVIWAVALTGEAAADRQLAAFKRHAPRGATCNAGLWRYSRHPNYFFEWLIWVGFALLASSAPWGLAAWTCPALMLYLLLRVTGIPATEAQALRTRGESYRRYQQTTSAFIPWLPRS